MFSFIKPSYKVLEGEVSVVATRQSSSDVKWRCYLESEGTESEVNKYSTVIKWQGSWKENAREDERESILFLGWIFALYLCCSPPLNLTKHSGNILSNKFKPKGRAGGLFNSILLVGKFLFQGSCSLKSECRD